MPRRADIQLPLRVWTVIDRHTIDDPITVPVLAQMFTVCERQVKGAIAELVDAGYKVGSNKASPVGVYRARTPMEIHETAMRLQREGLKLLARARKMLDWGSGEPTVWEQPPVLQPEEVAA